MCSVFTAESLNCLQLIQSLCFLEICLIVITTKRFSSSAVLESFFLTKLFVSIKSADEVNIIVDIEFHFLFSSVKVKTKIDRQK